MLTTRLYTWQRGAPPCTKWHMQKEPSEYIAHQCVTFERDLRKLMNVGNNIFSSNVFNAYHSTLYQARILHQVAHAKGA